MSGDIEAGSGGWKRQKVASTPAPPPPPSVAEVAQDYPPEKQAPQVEGYSVNAIEFQTSEDAMRSAIRVKGPPHPITKH